MEQHLRHRYGRGESRRRHIGGFLSPRAGRSHRTDTGKPGAQTYELMIESRRPLLALRRAKRGHGGLLRRVRCSRRQSHPGGALGADAEAMEDCRSATLRDSAVSLTSKRRSTASRRPARCGAVRLGSAGGQVESLSRTRAVALGHRAHTPSCLLGAVRGVLGASSRLGGTPKSGTVPMWFGFLTRSDLNHLRSWRRGVSGPRSTGGLLALDITHH
jgi:hypothetical protein